MPQEKRRAGSTPVLLALRAGELFMKRKHDDSRQPYAVVIDLNNMNGLQTARILARRGVPLIAFAKDPKHFICRTNVCRDMIFADTEGRGLIEALIRLGPRFNQKAVLFPCTDMNVLLISRFRRELEPWYHVVLPAPDVVELMMNKLSFYAYAREKNLPVPPFWLIRSRAEAEDAARQAPFPCVLKPPLSADPAWQKNSKLKAYKVADREQFLAAYDRYEHLTDTLILQTWIEGPETNLYTCNCYFDAKSEPMVTFVSRKLRQWPPVTGEGCLSVECRNDTVLQETLRLFRAVPRYRGLGYLEMKLDERTGRYFITEPNIGRPTGRSSIAEAGGVELVYTMYCDSIGWPLPPNREQKYRGAKWIYFRRDLQSSLYNWRRGKLSLREWRESMRGPKYSAIFSWSDLGPFIGDLQRSVRLFLTPRERKKRDYRKPLE